MRAKYVIAKHRETRLELAIVFSPIYNHKDFKVLDHEIISAGEVLITDHYPQPFAEPLIQCFGESQTLGLKSRGEEDADIIARNFRE
jgi:hypothetical protein